MAAKEASSFVTSDYAYDIFLSFRGEDTRDVFTTRLYSALVNADFGTFIDDNGIERGENIKSELVRAIQHSRGSIVVLSENYATSSWCLDEHAMIVKNKKRTGHVILPVFYYVTPSQVSKQMGTFESAFAIYEEECMEENDAEKKSQLKNEIKKWKAALTTVGELDGKVLRVQQDNELTETEFIQKTVRVIKDKLNRAVLTSAPSLIGVQSHVHNISLWLQDGSSDVSILVICGVGGIGKSAIAKYAYNLNFKRFQVGIFLENVRETSQKHGLILLQRELLSNIGRRTSINSVDEGIHSIYKGLRDKRCLLVLDDVDQIQQVNALLGQRDWFYPGSKIIITTRHKFLLKPHEDYKLMKVEPLDYEESRDLFNWYAFGQDHPNNKSYKALALRVLNRCQGIPLAIKVLGSSLSGRSLDVWASTLEKLEVVGAYGIMTLLRLSYDSLRDEHDKNLFLHIACFFVGRDKNHVVSILDACNFQTMVGLQILNERSLLVIDKHNILRMHQLLQDMGREVVRLESSKNPQKRSRLWHYKDSYDVLRDKSGTEAIEGLVLDMRFFREDELEGAEDIYYDATMLLDDQSTVFDRRSWPVSKYPSSSSSYQGESLHKFHTSPVEVNGFEKMQKLRLLQLNYVHPIGSYKSLPENLRWLCWHGFPLNYIPTCFPWGTIAVLEMSNSRLQRFWKQTKVAECLKIFDLSYSYKLATTPDFSGFPNLEALMLNDCVSLCRVDESIGNVKALLLLDLKNCISLKKLPLTLSKLKFLETLIISGCSKLDRLPIYMTSMTSLKVLKADGFAQQVPDDGDMNFGNACLRSCSLKPKGVIDISWASLPHSLVSLSLAYCNLSEDAFPRDLSSLLSLEELNLSGNPFCYLPDFIKNFDRLQSLIMNNCSRLQFLLDLPEINVLNIFGCELLETITHVSTSHKMQKVYYRGCDRLMEVHGYFYLTALRKISKELLNYLGLFELESMVNVKVNIQDGITFSMKQCAIQGKMAISRAMLKLYGDLQRKLLYEFGTSLSIVVPSLLNLQPRGLNICFLYTLSNLNDVETRFPKHQLFAKVMNYSKDLKWIYYPTCFGVPEVDQDMLWSSYWSFDDQLDGGDEINVSIIAGDSLQVKGCAVNFVYHEQNEYLKNNHLSWKEVIGGDLSAFKLSTGEYFLCRTSFVLNDKAAQISRMVDWTTTRWSISLFGGSVVDLKKFVT